MNRCVSHWAPQVALHSKTHHQRKECEANCGLAKLPVIRDQPRTVLPSSPAEADYLSHLAVTMQEPGDKIKRCGNLAVLLWCWHCFFACPHGHSRESARPARRLHATRLSIHS